MRSKAIGVDSAGRWAAALDGEAVSICRDNPAVQWLCQQRGIAELTAATIVDIRRFPSNNHLASYAGLTRHEHKTGRSTTEVSTSVYNFSRSSFEAVPSTVARR